ncbi:uncharacterized protein LOC128241669 [Mya arenaria]|uniref:uncharacterized protein LOC128241669 n=1 Tax=Mya arenaria TaxID=6604 RepID=UPI0022DF5E40|nr:uncharacterized protein LOC128241669 [Mya arenaria]
MRLLVMLILVVIGMDVICVSGKSFQFSQSVRNFGKHYLCQTSDQRKIFQRAILANACPSSYTKKNTGVENDVFMMFVDQTLCKETGVKHFLMPLFVGILCKDTGGWLEKWVRKYVDVDEDEQISPYEERWYFHRN